MSASADTPPTDIQHNEAPQYQVLGTGDGNDGRFAQGIVLIDPATGAPYAAAGGSGTGAVSIANGADVAQGATTDASTASTTIGLLKNLKAALAGTLAITVADGASVTVGATTDAASATTLIGLLKNLKAALAGTLAVAAATTTLVTPSTSTTTANADNTVTFSHSVTRYVLQNNSSATVYVNEGAAATLGSTAIASGSYLDTDLVPVVALHVYTTAVVSVNGSTAGGLVVRGTY